MTYLLLGLAMLTFWWMSAHARLKAQGFRSPAGEPGFRKAVGYHILGGASLTAGTATCLTIFALLFLNYNHHTSPDIPFLLAIVFSIPICVMLDSAASFFERWRLSRKAVR